MGDSDKIVSYCRRQVEAKELVIFKNCFTNNALKSGACIYIYGTLF